MNLNKGLMSIPVKTHSNVECHFRNLQQVLLGEIERADIVLGCVAWISDPLVLESLNKRSTALILDSKVNRMGKKLKGLYEQLRETNKEPIYRFLREGNNSGQYLCNTDINNKPVEGSYSENWNFEGGLYAVDGFYRYMHHKFLILIRIVGECPCGKRIYSPSVWTGSFNFTKNASNGLENAVVIRDNYISASYLCEFLEIYQKHARQLNVVSLDRMGKGLVQNGSGSALPPLCERGLNFPVGWFDDCCPSYYEMT